MATSFQDGPAKDTRLMLRRAARFLRVTVDGAKIDALDQPGDMPLDSERLYVYEIVSVPGWMHLNIRGNKGGMFPVANYRLFEQQPSEEIMRRLALWSRWCEMRARMFPRPELYKGGVEQ